MLSNPGVPLPGPSNSEVNQVQSYQKIMKTGRAVVVRNYQRRNIAQQNLGKYVFLGRPSIAAKPGTFAGNRTTPGLWNIADTSQL